MVEQARVLVGARRVEGGGEGEAGPGLDPRLGRAVDRHPQVDPLGGGVELFGAQDKPLALRLALHQAADRAGDLHPAVGDLRHLRRRRRQAAVHDPEEQRCATARSHRRQRVESSPCRGHPEKEREGDGRDLSVGIGPEVGEGKAGDHPKGEAGEGVARQERAGPHGSPWLVDARRPPRARGRSPRPRLQEVARGAPQTLRVATATTPQRGRAGSSRTGPPRCGGGRARDDFGCEVQAGGGRAHP